jgi:hypothetical protein
MITIRTKVVAPGLARLEKKFPAAIALGLTRGGHFVRTQVRKEFAASTGLKVGRVNELTPSKSAAPGNLRYEIAGKPWPNDARYLKVKPKLKFTNKGRVIFRNTNGDPHRKIIIGASGSLTAQLWGAKQWGHAKPSTDPLAAGAKLARGVAGGRYRRIYAANIAHEIAGTNPRTGGRILAFFMTAAARDVPPRILEQLRRALG